MERSCVGDVDTVIDSVGDLNPTESRGLGRLTLDGY